MTFQLVCLTMWQSRSLEWFSLITNCAQGMLDIVRLGVTYEDMPDQSVLPISLLTFTIFMGPFFRYTCSFLEYAVFLLGAWTH